MIIGFDPGPHIYTLDGGRVPNVTRVLESAGISDYRFLAPDDRERVLRRGKLVHQAVHYDNEGDLDESTLPKSIRGYLRAWRNFVKHTGFVVVKCEERVGSLKYRYAGTLDVRGFFPDQPTVEVVADIKTGHAEWWTATQTAAYCGTFDEPRKFRRICVELHGDGTYRVPVELQRDGRHWYEEFQIFLAALTVHNAIEKYSPRKVAA